MQRCYKPAFTALLFLLLGGSAIHAQVDTIDPRRDAALFRYVFDIPGRYINDHSLIRAGDLWHLFFILGDVGRGDWFDDDLGGSGHAHGAVEDPTASGTSEWYRDGNEITIGHATSENLVDWKLEENALTTGARGSLDAGHVYAPYVVERNGLYYMFYVGTERSFFAGEHLMLATSTDLRTWTRHPEAPIMQPDSSWAAYYPPGYSGGRGGPVSGRDPHLLEDPVHGYILYYVARLREDSAGAKGQRYACVAAATSTDLLHWKDHGPVLVRRIIDEKSKLYSHPESPCVVRIGDLYYLFWKGGEGMRYAISEDPLDFSNAEEHFLATSHASEVIRWNERWYITSCSRTLDDITHAKSDRTRGLYLAGIDWEGRLPFVVPLGGAASIASNVLDTLPSLYPNPVMAGERLVVTMPMLDREPSVEIVDVTGRSLLRSPGTRTATTGISGGLEVNTSGMAPGIYLVRMQSGNSISMHKLVVR